MANASEDQQQSASRPVYSGARRKLVIAFDIGTTFSGASYSILDPGNVPTIQGVNAFPNQRMGPSTGSKIPSVLYYDQEGKAVAIGAEALREGIEFEAGENDWVKAEWFKLHLRAGHTRDSARVAKEVPPLPLDKTVVEVFGDFIRYLMECTVAYIRDTHPNSAQLWESLKDNIAFVLSHPNGWEGYEQGKIRQAAVHSGIIDDTTSGHAQLTFVTEGEASLHFAIEQGVMKDAEMKAGDGVVVVDAGGGTIDVSAYTYDRADTERPGGPFLFKEAFIPHSYFQGSVFVTVRAMEHLRGMLANSAYLMDIEYIARCFDESAKVRFRDAAGAQYIKFGSTKDNDVDVNIRFGQLKLPGQIVAEFFQPSIDCIIDAVKEQIKAKPDRFKNVVLVGGFSGSQWLFNRVRDQLSQCGSNVSRVEHYANKVVSNGSVSFYLDRKVRSRLTKVAFGTRTTPKYDPHDAEHFARQHLAAPHKYDGILCLPSCFEALVKKNIEIPSGSKAFTSSFEVLVRDQYEARHYEVDLICYRGDHPSPRWLDDEPEQYSKLCTIQGDISKAPGSLHIFPGTGDSYYLIDYYINFRFSDNELSAFFSWWNDEKEGWEEGPGTIVYHPFDPIPSVGHYETQGAGNPSLPDPAPNQEGSQNEAPEKVEEKIQDEVPKKVEEKIQDEVPEQVEEKIQDDVPEKVEEKTQTPEDLSKADTVDPKPRHCRTCTCEGED